MKISFKQRTIKRLSYPLIFSIYDNKKEIMFVISECDELFGMRVTLCNDDDATKPSDQF